MGTSLAITAANVAVLTVPDVVNALHVVALLQRQIIERELVGQPTELLRKLLVVAWGLYERTVHS